MVVVRYEALLTPKKHALGIKKRADGVMSFKQDGARAGRRGRGRVLISGRERSELAYYALGLHSRAHKELINSFPQNGSACSVL